MTTYDDAMLQAIIQSLNILQELKENQDKFSIDNLKKELVTSVKEEVKSEVSVLDTSLGAIMGVMNDRQEKLEANIATINENITALLDATTTLVTEQTKLKRDNESLIKAVNHNDVNRKIAEALDVSQKNLKNMNTYVKDLSKDVKELTTNVEELNEAYTDTNARLKTMSLKNEQIVKTPLGLTDNQTIEDTLSTLKQFAKD